MTVKDSVFSVLQNSKTDDGFVSGQELAESCGVTRTSVWKAINALRSEGAQIEAVTNRGYRLVSNDVYNASEIQRHISDKSVKIKFFEELDSTNTQAKRDLAEKDAKSLHKTVYVAARQTAGRGRLGRQFYSPEESGIYFSIVFANGNITAPAVITASAGVAVSRALEKIYGADAKIKWVNDVFVGGRKVCGILTEGVANLETRVIEAAVVGIGINIVTNKNQPEELKNIAGSLISSFKNRRQSELCAEVVNEFLAIMDGGQEEIKKSMQEYKDRSFLIGREIEISPVINSEDKNYKCVVQDITEDAKLVVRLKNGEIKALDSGEISIHSRIVV